MQTGEDEQYVKLSEGVVLFTGDTRPANKDDS